MLFEQLIICNDSRIKLATIWIYQLNKQSNHGIEIKQPISLLNRSLKISPKTFISSLTKATINGLKGDIDDCAENLIDSIVDIKAEEKLGQLAWILIYQSLQNAISELISESTDLLELDKAPNLSTMEKEFENKIIIIFKNKLVISSEFLDKPDSLNLLNDFSPFIENFCTKLGATEIDSKSIASKLHNKFALNIYKLWIESSDKFQVLINALESPLSKSNNELRKWNIYHQYLHVDVEKRVFKESFGLKDIYVSPRAFYKAPKLDDIGKPTNNTDLITHVVDLHSYLEKWLLKQDTSDNVKLISGAPGSGKSSFSKSFASDIAKNTGYNVLLIQLHLLDMTKDLNLAIQSYCDNYISLRDLDVLSSDKLLVLFDGLDEISMQGKIGATVSTNFINELKRKSEFFSKDRRNVKFLVTGRDLSIQSCESIVKESKKYLNLIPYYIPEHGLEYRWKNCHDPKGLLKIDQRQIWWEKFSTLKGLSFTSMPEEIDTSELSPISSQPLLGYLLALSYLRGQIDFNNNPNLNTIYQDLLDSVFERQYASEDGDISKTHSSVSMLSSEDFDLLMQEIALAVWHANGTTATEKFIYEHLKTNELEHLLEQFKSETENGVSSLLLSFYFRKQGQTVKGESTFEFTHKSFGEYLTAKKLVNLTIDLSDAYADKKKNHRKGKKLDDIIYEWIRATGKSTFEIYLFQFVKNELCNLELDIQKIQQIYDFLAVMLNDSIQNNLAFERFSGLTFNQMISYSQNANLALVALHSACSRILYNDELCEISEDLSKDEAENVPLWLHRNLENYRFSSHLEYMNFSNATLGFMDFSDAELQFSNLNNTTIFNSSFVESRATGIKLSCADIIECNFSHSALYDADMSNAIISSVDFSSASMQEMQIHDCRFSDSKLIDSELNNSNLTNSVFNNTDCKGAIFADCILTNTMLIGANLVEADFSGAYMDGCNLSGANLTDADLTAESMRGIKLKGAILKGAKLSGVDLTGVDLTGVDLTGVDLTGCNYNSNT